MKKTLVIAAMVVGLGCAGFGVQQASADRGDGPGMGYGMGGHGMGYGMGLGGFKGGPGYAQLDQASKAKLDKFFDETKELRKQMVVKHAEQRAIMHADNPDPEKAAKVAGEMFDLHTAMQAKAEAAGVQELLGKVWENGCPRFNGADGFGKKGGGQGRPAVGGPGTGPNAVKQVPAPGAAAQ